LSSNLIHTFDLGADMPRLSMQLFSLLENPIRIVTSLGSMQPPRKGNADGINTFEFKWPGAFDVTSPSICAKIADKDYPNITAVEIELEPLKALVDEAAAPIAAAQLRVLQAQTFVDLINAATAKATNNNRTNAELDILRNESVGLKVMKEEFLAYHVQVMAGLVPFVAYNSTELETLDADIDAAQKRFDELKAYEKEEVMRDNFVMAELVITLHETGYTWTLSEDPALLNVDLINASASLAKARRHMTCLESALEAVTFQYEFEFAQHSPYRCCCSPGLLAVTSTGCDFISVTSSNLLGVSKCHNSITNISSFAAYACIEPSISVGDNCAAHTTVPVCTEPTELPVLPSSSGITNSADPETTPRPQQSDTSQNPTPGGGAAAGGVLAGMLVVALVIFVVIKRKTVAQNAASRAIVADKSRASRDAFLLHFVHLATAADDGQARAEMDATFKALNTPRSSLSFHSQLAAGEFGDMHYATLQSNNTNGRHAIDVVARTINAVLVVEQQLLEVRLLAALKHPHIIELVGVVVASMPVVILTGKMQNGDLRTYLRACRSTVTNRKEKLGVHELLRIGTAIASAAAYLETKKVVHRALMAKSVLVGADHRDVRLSGFESIRGVFRQDEYISTARARNQTRSQQLLVQWKAPETLRYEVYTIKSDVWSFGVLLWEVLSFGRQPFGTFKAAEVTAEIAAGRRLDPPDVCPPVLATAMNACWQFDPQERLTFASVEGVLRLLLIPESVALLAKVEAASQWHPDGQVATMRGRRTAVTASAPNASYDTARYERPMRNWQRTSEAVAPFGIGCGEMRWREYKSADAMQTIGSHKAMLGLVAEFPREIVTLKGVLQTLVELSHPQVLECIGCSSVAGFSVLFACPSHGTLRSVLDQGNAILSTPLQRERILIDVALGLEYLDANDAAAAFVITSSTVFVTAELGARICISGHVLITNTLSGVVNQGRQITDELLRWGAPELIAAEPSPPTSASAVWGFGVVLWEVFSTVGAGLPYSPLSTTALHAAAGGEQGRPKLMAPTELPDVCKSVFAGCQMQTASTRPNMSSLTTMLLEELADPEWWELPRDELEFMERLGSGQFGDVNKMAARLFPDTPAGSSDSFVAVKTLKAGDGSAVDNPTTTMHAMETEFLAEVEVMKSLRHPNLVTLLGVCTKERPLLMVLEYLPGGSLDVWLPKCGKHARPFELLRIVNQAARGMVALGTAGIIHRDLAARNVLVDEKLRVKIADFGLSREASDGDDRNYYRMKTARPLPLRWTAPEVVTKLLYSVRSDVYAFGVFMFEVYSFGAFPFGEIKNDQTFLGVLGGTNVAKGAEPSASLAVDLPSSKVSGAPVEVQTLLEECLFRDSNARPTFADIMIRTKMVRTSAIPAIPAPVVEREVAPVDVSSVPAEIVSSGADRSAEAAEGYLVVGDASAIENGKQESSL
jgi:abelson tyrosine-protein kinase 1